MVEHLIDRVIAGESAFSVLQERLSSNQVSLLSALKPNTKVRVFHGTSKVYLPMMINGFDAATQEMVRHYGSSRHKGLFVSVDLDVAERFSNYGELILDLEVKAKNLHATDYSGNIWSKKEDTQWKDKYPNSFRPGLSYLLTEPSVESQALLVGMVGPRQIKRICWKDNIKGKGKWYTRAELLAKKVTIHGESGSGGSKHKLRDFGINTSSTRITVPKLIKAIAVGLDVDVAKVERALMLRAGFANTERLHDMLRYDFKFGAASAKVLTQKVIKYYKERR